MTSSSSTSTEQRLRKLSQLVDKECLDNPSPTAETCLDLLQELQKESPNISLDVLENTKIGKVLIKARKSFQRHKRSALSSSNEGADWERAIQQVNQLMEQWKSIAAKQEATERKAAKSKAPPSSSNGPPSTPQEYRARLVQQKKELYKDPPVLPPTAVVVETERAPPPKRNKTTGALSFQSLDKHDDDTALQSMLQDFHPNLTPEQVLRAGSFGGTYFRSISSAVTNQSYQAKTVLQDTVAPEWIDGLAASTMLTSQTYRVHINKYGVKCGGSLGMWESSGWITSLDPYGWFQWYCRFYQGRRSTDDVRQISRWLKCAGPKGRFRSQLCNKILAAPGAKHDDASISPVIRQTLLHWGLDITADILQKHRKRVGR